MGTVAETLAEHVDELIAPPDRKPILSTTGTRETLASLALRTQALEHAGRELTTVIRKLTEAQGRD
jgi:hypothetical protein